MQPHHGNAIEQAFRVMYDRHEMHLAGDAIIAGWLLDPILITRAKGSRCKITVDGLVGDGDVSARLGRMSGTCLLGKPPMAP